MKSIIPLLFLVACAELPSGSTSWEAVLPADPDPQVSLQPVSLAVSPDGDAIVTETAWSCVTGGSARVLRVDGVTGEATAVDGLAGFAAASVSGESGFSALFGASPTDAPWDFGLVYRAYDADGAPIGTLSDTTASPVELAGSPDDLVAVRGTWKATGVPFVRALRGGLTVWSQNEADPAHPLQHVAVAGGEVVGTWLDDAGQAHLRRYDAAGGVRSDVAFCGTSIAAGPDGAVFGVGLSEDQRALAVCRDDGTADGAWTTTEALADDTFAWPSGVAWTEDGAYVVGTDFAGDYGSESMWTRRYDARGRLVDEISYDGEEGFASGIAVAAGANGAVYALGQVADQGAWVPYVARLR